MEVQRRNFQKKEKTYGKTIIFTDLKNWTAEKIAKTYNFKNNHRR